MIIETKSTRFDSLDLDCGETLAPVDVAYQSYGALNEDRSNAIMILHAFTGDAHVAGISPETGKPGWWDNMIGPGKAFDTDQYFVICSNVLGGCGGTTGPSSVNPNTGKPYGMHFPVITISDMVRLQKQLVDRLGIQQAARGGRRLDGRDAVAGVGRDVPRHGGRCDPDRRHVAALARSRSPSTKSAGSRSWPTRTGTTATTTAANPRRAASPSPGWSGHITYMSDESMREKFGRRLREKERFGFDFEIDFEVESYLRYRGNQFVDRFDANSYLYITKAMDYFDISNGQRLAGAPPWSTPRRVSC